MNPLRVINSISGTLKHLALAVPLAAAMWLGAGPSAQAIPTDSLIHYDFNSVSGTTVTNNGSLGSAADGTLANASLVAGQFGNGLSFTGSGSGVRTNNNVAIGNAFTLACWVSTTVGNGGYKRIIVNDHGQSGYLGTDSPSKYLTIVKGNFVQSATGPDTSGVWHHLAMTWDGTTQNFYYDGVLNTTTVPSSRNTTYTQKFGFGCNLGLGENWSGKMDEAFVFGRALSLAEIGSLYTNAPNTAPVVPTGVAATPVSSGTVSVSWAADTNATSRDVSVTNTVTTVEQVFTTSAATSYSATGLTNGTLYDFKVRATNALGTSAYSSVVSAIPVLSTAKNILNFLVPGQPDGVISGTNISVTVPVGTNVTAFSPTYTVSNLASGSPASGTTRNFTSPQTYTITAEDTSTQDYTVTVTEGAVASIYTWTTGTSGNWSDSTKWTNDLSNGLRPGTFGQFYYTLNFNQAVTATNDLSASYVVNKLNFGNTVTLAGNSLALTTNGATLPTINQNSGNQVTLNTPLSLVANTTFGGTSTGQVDIGGNITGAGSLTKSNGGTLNLNGANTYTGGTLISAGTVSCSLQNASPLGGAGTVNVTVQSGATLAMNRNQITGSLTLNGGKVATGNGWADDQWNGPVALSGNSTVDVGSTDGALALNGVVSGTGTLTKLGSSLRVVSLNAANTFTGTIAITQGTIGLGSTGSINNVALISIGAAGIFDVSAKSAFALTTSNSLAATSTGATLTTQAKVKGAAAGTVSLGSQPVTLNYNAINPALTITQGTLVLNANPFTVNTASPLAVGTYTIASQTAGSITSSGTYPSVIGTAIGVGTVGTISVSGSNVVLTVAATPYNIWANGTFTNPFTDKAPTSNPDGDTLTNLQEYAFGTDPTTSSAGPIVYADNVLTGYGPPEVSNFAGGPNGVDYRMVFCRRKNPASLGLTYTAEFSVDFTTWSANAVTPTVLATDAAGVMEVVSVPYPLFIATVRGVEKPTFSHVKVESN